MLFFYSLLFWTFLFLVYYIFFNRINETNKIWVIIKPKKAPPLEVFEEENQ